MKLKNIWIAFFVFIIGCSAFAAPIDISYENGIYHIVLNGDKIKKKIKFISSESLVTNKEAHQKAGAKLTINAGFFDPENEETISYVVTDRQTTADPIFNKNLFANAILRKNIDKILNRSEFRVLECDDGYRYEIVPHKTGVDFACAIVTSAQGGPMILPELRLEEEFFVVKDEYGNVIRESASVLHKTSRTIIGLKDGIAHILIITDENPMDMYDVQTLCKKLGFDRAMGFDGGSSTSMNYLDKYEVISTKGDGGGRILKSFMVVY